VGQGGAQALRDLRRLAEGEPGEEGGELVAAVAEEQPLVRDDGAPVVGAGDQQVVAAAGRGQRRPVSSTASPSTSATYPIVAIPACLAGFSAMSPSGSSEPRPPIR